MNFTERTKLSKKQKMEIAKELLEKVEYYGLDPEFFMETPSFKKALSTATDQFEILRDIPGALIRIAREIDNMKRPVDETDSVPSKPPVHGMTIMQIAIADANDLTMGEYLFRAIEEFKKAGFMDVKIKDILCQNAADEMLTVAMCKNPGGVNATFQYEEMLPLLAWYDKITNQCTAKGEAGTEGNPAKEEIVDIDDLIRKIYEKEELKKKVETSQKIASVEDALNFLPPELIAAFIERLAKR